MDLRLAGRWHGSPGPRTRTRGTRGCLGLSSLSGKADSCLKWVSDLLGVAVWRVLRLRYAPLRMTDLGVGVEESIPQGETQG